MRFASPTSHELLQDRFCRDEAVAHDTAKLAPCGLLIYAGALAASIGVVLQGESVATILAAATVGGGFGALFGAVLARLLDRRRSTFFEEESAVVSEARLGKAAPGVPQNRPASTG